MAAAEPGDAIFRMHDGGKMEVRSKVSLRTHDDLSKAYTPGVAQVSLAIHRNPAAIYDFTIKRNTVAVVSDGTAVLGLGDIGPEAALPVMEGKAILFKELAGVDAWPVCLATKDPDEIVETVKRIAPVFGGINLEDISAPRCFAIEERLRRELPIPVFHDDQHGTAVVVLAGVINALKVVGKSLDEIKVVISGAGAAGCACAQMLLRAGVKNMIVCDRRGIIHRGRQENMNFMKEWLAENTNAQNVHGVLLEAMERADLFVGVSAANLVTPEHLRRMAKDPIVFAMANPNPEITPEEALPFVRVMATGRSDYPNQVNNALCFPGMFRGALDVRAGDINEEMKLAAAHAIANVIPSRELTEGYIVPSVFDERVVPSVAQAVAQAARETGVAEQH